MKMKSINITIILLFVLIMSPLSAQSYDFVSMEKLPSQEISAELAKTIFSKAGFNLVVTPVPGDRARLWSTNGTKDGEVSRIEKFGDVNKTLVRVPTPISAVVTRAYTLKSKNIVINSIEDMKKYNVAITRGVKNVKDMVEGFPNVNEMEGTEQLMKFLNAGRADIVLTSNLGGQSMIAKLGLTTIEVNTILEELPLYLYFHEKNKDAVAKVDTILKQMKDSGELSTQREALEEKYFSTLK